MKDTLCFFLLISCKTYLMTNVTWTRSRVWENIPKTAVEPRFLLWFTDNNIKILFKIPRDWPLFNVILILQLNKSGVDCSWRQGGGRQRNTLCEAFQETSVCPGRGPGHGSAWVITSWGGRRASVRQGYRPHGMSWTVPQGPEKLPNNPGKDTDSGPHLPPVRPFLNYAPQNRNPQNFQQMASAWWFVPHLLCLINCDLGLPVGASGREPAQAMKETKRPADPRSGGCPGGGHSKALRKIPAWESLDRVSLRLWSKGWQRAQTWLERLRHTCICP